MAESMTPMVKQYQEIKSRYSDAILFYRLGDFYEMFNDDAKLASKELDLTLTGRGEGEGRMPMCGIPYHAASGYIAKLIGRGYKVAICEQVEDPKTAKGIVKRDVIKVITPGTVQDGEMLNEKASNYLLAVAFTKDIPGIAYADASTGEFKATTFKDITTLTDEIRRVDPAEVLFPDIVPENFKALEKQLKDSGKMLTTYKDTYDQDVAAKKLKEHFGVSFLEGFGLSGFEAALPAACAILDYLGSTQKGELGHIARIQPYRTGQFMYIDPATRRNLELLITIKDKATMGSLVWVLDRTATPMGGRLLKKWLLEPSIDIAEINSRYDAVEELSKDSILRGEIKNVLTNVRDIERLTGRIAMGSCTARDLVSLKESLNELPKLKEKLKTCKSQKISAIQNVPENIEVADLIENAIVIDPPFTIKEGNIIRKGYDAELDKIREMSVGGKQWISQLEKTERERTGIKSLKVGYTSVFGYYIEISKANLPSVPSDYIRKQTLVNCERFITPDLKDKEALILNAEAKMNTMEYEIFQKVRLEAAKHTASLQEVSRFIEELDVLLSLASVAAENKYVRPLLHDKKEVHIRNGRHPVIEATLGSHSFIPNDTEMKYEDSRFLLITGPNMAGKSTYMRQVALIMLLAQIGSFVPADSAKLPVFDRIFTRVGAMDDIFSGQSTFMVEMTETANIMNNATKDSFIILDEIGRGTSTFDGMSIAAAASEFINEKIGAFTLFATHYHEITQLEKKLKGVKNFNTLVKKDGDGVLFLHKIVAGAADQSYGIEVAVLAGMPRSITERAKEIYKTLEMVESGVATNKAASKTRKDQMGLFL